MSDETLESLQAELEALKKANLEREIALEKAKKEEAEELKRKEKEEELREQIREEEKEKLLEEFNEKKNITKDKPEKMNKENKLEIFKQGFVRKMNDRFKDKDELSSKHQYTGLSYEDRIKQLVDGDYPELTQKVK